MTHIETYCNYDIPRYPPRVTYSIVCDGCKAEAPSSKTYSETHVFVLAMKAKKDGFIERIEKRTRRDYCPQCQQG